MTRPEPSTRPPLSWRGAAAPTAFAGLAYLLLPSFAPHEIDPTTGVLLLGVLLALVVGAATHVDARVVRLMAAASGVGLLVHFSVQIGLSPLVIMVSVVVGVEVWAVPTLLRRSGTLGIERPADVWVLLLVSLVVAVAAGSVTAVVVALTDGAGIDAGAAFRGWVVDDVWGLVVVAPFVMVLKAPAAWLWRRAGEFAAIIVVSLGSVWFVFVVADPASPGYLGWPYIVVIGPIWAAVRLGVGGAAAVVAVTFWTTTLLTTAGEGTFARAGATPYDRLLTVEVFSITMAVIALSLAALRDERLRSLQEITAAHRFMTQIVDGSDAAIWAKSYRATERRPGVYTLVNRAAAHLLGRSPDEVTGRVDSDLLPPAAAQAVVAEDVAVLESGESRISHPRSDRAGGQGRIFTRTTFPLTDDDGVPWGVASISTDVTDLIHARESADRQAELLLAVFDRSPMPALRLRTTGPTSDVIVDANHAVCRLLEVEEDTLLGTSLLDHVHADDRRVAASLLAQTQGVVHPATAMARQQEVRLRTHGGRTAWVLLSAAAFVGGLLDAGAEMVVQIEDVTARREAERALSEQALRDAVTGLPNRRALNDRANSALQRMRRKPGMVSILFCDLDHFKEVNDSLGHQVGDLLLVEAADRLQSVVRPEDTLARLGGDEFVFLGEGFASTADVVRLAGRMQECLGAPWVHDQQEFRPAMCVGIAVTSDPEVSVDELLRRADLAMYRAKAAGRGRIEVYQRTVDEAVQQSVLVQHRLRDAIERGGLLLHYQPIVRLPDREVVGVEALVRMQGPNGLVMPGEFVPEAESSGLAVPMGDWVLDQVLHDVGRWDRCGEPIHVSVNVSPVQLRSGFAAGVLSRLERAAVDPAHVSVEVTETALLQDPSGSGRELLELGRAGVGISLDDFGTGYSSLSWLTRLQVTTVKIDRSFTATLGADERKSAIVRGVISMAHELGLTVVAEGVETEDQYTLLTALGCDQAQGYLFGRPEPLDPGTFRGRPAGNPKT